MVLCEPLIHVDELKEHLGRCSLHITDIIALDLNVYRVDTAHDSALVARIFRKEDPHNVGAFLHKLLHHIREHGFPAEEDAEPDDMSELGNPNICILLTKFVLGARPPRNKETFYRLGKLLGKLHQIPITEALRNVPAGAWHHTVIPGGVLEECAATISMLDLFAADHPEETEKLASLVAAVRRVEQAGIEKLPMALVHPDLVPSNVIAQPNEPHAKWTVIDWAGAGLGTRMLSLGWLLSVSARVSPGLANAVLKGYEASGATLESSELGEALPACIYLRMLTIQCWEVATSRKKASEIAAGLTNLLKMAHDVADRTRKVWAVKIEA